MPVWTKRLLSNLRPIVTTTPVLRMIGAQISAAGLLGQGNSWPLLHPDRDLVVGWSPKAGCTPTLIWFFHQIGVLDAALARNSFVHRYRNEVYHRSAVYHARCRALLRSGGKGFTLLRVTRDPDKRLMSSFRHAVNFPLLDGLAQEKLGVDLRETGLSLRNLARLLEDEDISGAGRIDPHFRPQRQPMWAMDFDRVITLNMDRTPLLAGLNEVEAGLNLPVTDFAVLGGALGHDTMSMRGRSPIRVPCRWKSTGFAKSAMAVSPRQSFWRCPCCKSWRAPITPAMLTPCRPPTAPASCCADPAPLRKTALPLRQSAGSGRTGYAALTLVA